ncbi:hypothetical protein [Pseudonocardia spinosispora]|uniref:hypothetical protein n=1 Tax=Pseudonocardia spinosispora TaxID=103441 RepID=UPI00048C18F6|nr:hypothetical protein [Pseudonocardia spinosispora]
MNTWRLAWACALVLGVCGCAAPAPAPPAPPPPGPTRALVTWADSVCTTTTTLRERQASLRRLPGDASASDPFTEMDVDQYLTFAGLDAQSLTKAFQTQPPSGIPEADALVAGYAKAMGDVSTEISGLAGEPGASQSLSLPDKLVRARRIGQLFDSVKPSGPDLPAIAERNPTLKSAYDVAPRCEPAARPGAAPVSVSPGNPGPLPPARDGTDVAACQDGTCQISVSGSVDLTVNGLALRISVESGKVTAALTDSNGSTSTSEIGSPGSTATLSNGAKDVNITLLGLEGNTAVLDLTP